MHEVVAVRDERARRGFAAELPVQVFTTWARTAVCDAAAAALVIVQRLWCREALRCLAGRLRDLCSSLGGAGRCLGERYTRVWELASGTPTMHPERS